MKSPLRGVEEDQVAGRKSRRLNGGSTPKASRGDDPTAASTAAPLSTRRSTRKQSQVQKSPVEQVSDTSLALSPVSASLDDAPAQSEEARGSTRAPSRYLWGHLLVLPRLSSRQSSSVNNDDNALVASLEESPVLSSWMVFGLTLAVMAVLGSGVVASTPFSESSRAAAAVAEAARLVANEQARLASVELAATGGGHTDQCRDAWEWISSLGSPATLVGGAALASFFELRESLAPNSHDSTKIRLGKNVVLLLLLGAFASEIACVYINTITGDHLMANSDAPAPAPFGQIGGDWGRNTGHINCMGASPMGMLQRELEFEFLASRVGFFQGERRSCPPSPLVPLDVRVFKHGAPPVWPRPRAQAF